MRFGYFKFGATWLFRKIEEIDDLASGPPFVFIAEFEDGDWELAWSLQRTLNRPQASTSHVRMYE